MARRWTEAGWAPPASTLVEARRLFQDDVLLEVEAIAAVRDRP